MAYKPYDIASKEAKAFLSTVNKEAQKMNAIQSRTAAEKPRPLNYLEQSATHCLYAIGEFIGDLVSSINFNAQLIIDNLKKYFDTKFIPDSEYIEFLLSDCIGWYSQIQGLLAEKDFSDYQ